MTAVAGPAPVFALRHQLVGRVEWSLRRSSTGTLSGFFRPTMTKLPGPGLLPRRAARTPVWRIHPCEMPELRELLRRVLRNGRASTIKLTCRTKLGTFLPTEISLHALDIDGRTRILGLVQDRSEHRQPSID